MRNDVPFQAFAGLERSCNGPIREWIISAPARPGIERIEACFIGNAFQPHRHDTYALGVTLEGVQTFRYRGRRRYSTPGKIIVLHPDEVHDGGAGTDDGLRYRMLYLDPSLLRRALEGNRTPLPFVEQPVVEDESLRSALLSVLKSLDDGIDDLPADDFVAEVAETLSRHAGTPLKPISHIAWRAAGLARDFLYENADRSVRSEELERLTGVDRYALSRHFRAQFATSPHRFLIMRRLQRARGLMEQGLPLAEVAVAAGFADQSHLNRHFKNAFGVTPGRWVSLVTTDR